jgi:octaprenyl-diphosphate synthase
VVLAYAGADEKERLFWKRAMEEKRQEAGDYEEACAIIARHDAMERGRDMARTYGEKARLALAEAPDSALRALLDELVTFTIDRTY